MTREEETASRPDRRFLSVNNDPRFRRPKKKASRVKIDERFRGIFEEPEFRRPMTVDKYGRRLADDANSGRDLRHFYELEDEKSDSNSECVEEEPTSDEDSGSAGEMDDDQEDDLMDQVMASHPLVNREVAYGDASKRLALVNMDWDQIRAVDIFTLVSGFKPATGSVLSVAIYPSEFGKERLAREAIQGPPTAIFKAEKDSQEKSIPSDSQDSDASSVPAESGKNLDSDSSPGQPRKPIVYEEEGDFDEAQLRKYQLERLRYYYAVIECDSMETAAAIYRACDGSEFEQSGNFLDLRYIPDSLDLPSPTESSAVDACTAADRATLQRYNPKTDMETGALNNSGIRLTWDQDDPERARITRTNFLSKEERRKLDMRDVDLAAYLASASSSSDAGEEFDREAYRQRLLGGDKKDDVFGRKSADRADQLKITFASAFSQPMDNGDGQEARGPARDSSRDSGRDSGHDSDVHAEATFDIDETAALAAEDETVFEREQRKRREKKAARRIARLEQQQQVKASQQQKGQLEGSEEARPASAAELKALLRTDATRDLKHFDLTESKGSQRRERKRQKRDRENGVGDDDAHSSMQAEFRVNPSDDRFRAIYERPDYAIDPSASTFKRTPGMQALLEERARRRAATSGND